MKIALDQSMAFHKVLLEQWQTLICLHPWAKTIGVYLSKSASLILQSLLVTSWHLFIEQYCNMNFQIIIILNMTKTVLDLPILSRLTKTQDSSRYMSTVHSNSPWLLKLCPPYQRRGTYCFLDGSCWCQHQRRHKTSCPLCTLDTLWNILMILGRNVDQD